MSETALIVIDTQHGLLAEPERLHDPVGVLQRIDALVSRARDAGVPVLFIQHDGGPGHTLEKGTAGWAIDPRTGYHDGDRVVEKRFCDGFQGTTLASELGQLGAKRLVLAGMCSDYCVDTTCRRAFAEGYQVALASDAHTTFNRDYLPADAIVRHHNAILGTDFATVLPSAEIAFHS
ncbi:MAG: cysteine hydrolase [Proteobacteria bacterium]|nr:cysteine hydrolase [Pseudomonadota bacterium]